MEATSLHFAAAARTIGGAARQRGLLVPSFRSPPRVPGADRTIRRSGSGSLASPTGSAAAGPTALTVAVRYRGRPWNAVLADLIEGVVVANRLRGPQADGCRTALWAALEARRAVDERTIAAA